MAAAAPPRELPPAERAALQQASQYAGSQIPWTPENAEAVGLDPERGFIARGVPTSAPVAPPTPPEPRPPSMAAGLGTLGGAPAQPAAQPKWAQAKPVEAQSDAQSQPKWAQAKPVEDQSDAQPQPKWAQAKPVEEPAQPIQAPAPQQPAPPQPSVTAAPQRPPEQPPATYPTIAEDQPGPADPHSQIQALIASGKTPGEAQAAIAGQPAKTLAGETPAPKPAPPKAELVDVDPDKPYLDYLARAQGYRPGMAPWEQAATTQQTPAQPTTTPKPASADTTGVADFFRKRGDQPITSSNDPRLTTVTAGGQNWQVNKDAAPAFQGFVSELASKGAPITLGTGGGWAYREKVGAKGISEHAYGGAIDVNQLPGQRGKITPEFQKWIAANPGLLQQIEQHWNIYGGERFGDLGHFEWGGVPISTTKTTATTGAAAPSAALGPDDVQAAAQLDKNLGGLLKGKGSVYVAMGKKYGVDPRLLAAISMEETGNGTSHLLRSRNNVGGITGKGHSGIGGDYMPYNSIEEGIEAEASLIRHGYIGQGLDTIEKIGAKWAPGGAANDPQGTNLEWPSAVRKFYAALGGTGKLGATSGEYPAFAGGGGGGAPPAGGAFAGQPLASIPSAGGTPRLPEVGPAQQRVTGGGGGVGGSTPEAQTTAGSINLSPGIAEAGAAALGGALGTVFGGGGRPQAAQPSEEKGPSPSDVVTKVLAAGGPPPAPGATPVDLSTMKQANVLGVRTLGAPQLGLPAPPAAPSATPAAPDPIVIKGLMKRGFTREQALAFAAKATVSKPGAAAIAGAASFRKPAQLPAPPAAPAAKPQPPPPQPQAPLRPVPPAQAGVAPKGSTVGVARPAGSEAITKWPRLADQAKQHAAILSPDDPRVRKQADGKIKGEHFVEGDPFHDQLLNGLPGGHGGRQRQILGEAEQAIAEKRPLHISYISSPKEAALYPTRESRRIQYEAHSPQARLMGTTEGQLVGHSMIPVSVGITPSGKAAEPHQSVIHGLSTNVLANNFQHVNTKLAAMGLKTPYASFGPKFANDLEGYLHNLNAGHTGTGRGYAIGTAEYPNEPDTEHVPYKLTRREADFLNTVINNTGAFAKHEDGKALRELARANGTLITPEGETNRMRHEMEQHEPGWRQRMLEPSIRSFKTGLIHEIHPSEEHLPATIRPGQEYRDLTAAMQRTSYRGRPDVPVSVSLHHTFADNKAINQIEREFSDKRINEAEARQRLHALGEDPDQYRFIGGSGGLITPYEENPEAITPEEHSQLKDNLRKQWIGGKLNVEDYRKKTAEVPLPELPSRSAAQKEMPSEEPAPAKAPQPSAAEAKPDPDHARALKLWKEHGTEGLKKILQTSMTVRELKDKYGLELSGEKMHRVLSGAAAFPKIAAFYSKLPGLEQPSGGVLKMQGGGVVPDPADPDPDPSPLDQHLGGVLAGHGSDFEAAGAKYGVDPTLLAAIATFESGHGTSSAATKYNNVMGVSTPSPHHKFDSVEDSIDKGASNLSRNYLQQGLTTIPQIGAVYSPVRSSGQRVSNDRYGTNKEWPDTVQKLYTQMGGTNTFFGPQTVGVGVNAMGGHPQPPPPSPNWSPSPGEAPQAPPPNQPPPVP